MQSERSGNRKDPEPWTEEKLQDYAELTAESLAQAFEKEGFVPQLDHIDPTTKVCDNPCRTVVLS